MAIQTVATDQFITVNGLRLHYLDWGNERATPVVLLHGLRGFAHTWDPVARPLADRFHLLALDQRGRGESEWAPEAEYNTDAYVSDIEGFVDQLGLRQFVLVGHSMGGANTLAYTSKHPDRVKAAVIEDVGPGSLDSPGSARIAREMEATPVRFSSWAEAEAFCRKERPGASDDVIRARLGTAMKQLPDGSAVTWVYDLEGIRMARRAAQAQPRPDLWPAVKALRCPTLVLRGGATDILTRETVEEMARVNPLVRWAEVPGASHFVHEDNLEVFNLEVSAFLKEVASISSE